MDRRVTLTLWNAAINCVAAGADTQDPLPPLLPLPRRTCQAGLRPVRRTPACGAHPRDAAGTWEDPTRTGDHAPCTQAVVLPQKRNTFFSSMFEQNDVIQWPVVLSVYFLNNNY